MSDILFVVMFFGLIGFYGVYVFVGLMILFVMMIWVFCGYFLFEYYYGIELGGIYWYFVDVMWIVVYVIVYFF